MAKKRKTELWEGLTIALIGTVFFAVLGSGTAVGSKTGDFLNLYGAGKLVLEDHTRLFDWDAQTKVQYTLAPRIQAATPFPRPAFAALYYAPFSLLPLDIAYILWLAAGMATMFGIWWWAWRQFGPEALVYCAFFVPLFFGIVHGQDNAFLFGALLLSYCAAAKHRDTLAGILLGLLLVKFHLFLTVPLVLIAQRKWRILSAYVLTGLVAIGVSISIASPESYIHFLRTAPGVDLAPSMMFNVRAVLVNLGLDNNILTAIGALVTAAAAVTIPRGVPVHRWFWAMAAAGLLVSPHTYGYDASLMLVPILLILFEPGTDEEKPRRKYKQWIALLGTFPMTYFSNQLPPPFAGLPAVLMIALFLATAYPAWFERSAPACGLAPRPGVKLPAVSAEFTQRIS